jgi:hypothetical protein
MAGGRWEDSAGFPLFAPTAAAETGTASQEVRQEVRQETAHDRAVAERFAAADLVSGTPYADFWLPSLSGQRWFRGADFHGRPTVFLHIATWSPACRRLLPLWFQQLQPAVDRGDLQVVVVVHDHHAAPARWLLNQLQIDAPAIHDPFNLPLPTGAPQGVLVDAAGEVRQERLTLNRLDQDLRQWLSAAPRETKSPPAAERGSGGEAPPALPELRQQLQQRQATEPAYSPRVTAVADSLLLAAYHGGGEAAEADWQIAGDYYRQAWQATGHSVWAWRLVTAYRFQWDSSLGHDAVAFQEAHRLARLAAERDPTGLPTRVWQNQFGPRISKTQGAYPWLPTDWCEPPTAAPESSGRQHPFLLAAETIGPWTAAQAAAEQIAPTPASVPPIARSETAPLPWQAVEVVPIWAVAPAAGLGGEPVPGSWARLYLQIKLKRDFSLGDDRPLLHWAWNDEDEAGQPRWTPFSVAIPPSGRGANPPLAPRCLWLEADCWFPPLAEGRPPAGDLSSVDPAVAWPESPPRRNATLWLRSREGEASRPQWRRIEFWLPPPSSATIDP